MKQINSARRWVLLAVMAAPIFANSSCISNVEKLLFASNDRNNDVGSQVNGLLDSVGNLVDSIF